MAGRRAERDAVGTVPATSTVVQLPRRRSPGLIEITRLLPSARSLLVAFAIALCAIAGYFVARDTSIFAVRTIEVDGAPPSVALQVKKALRDDLGTSLLRLDLGRVRQEIAAVPTVASATFDRAFPNTLRIVVVPERSVAVIRQGAASWLVSARGRIIASLRRGAMPRLPRIWVPKGAVFSVGGTVPRGLDASLAAVAPLDGMRFPARVASVHTETDELSLELHSGVELRLGDSRDVALKLAVAAKVLPLVAANTRYVDVSVPDRPVAGSIVERATTPTTSTTATTATAGPAQSGVTNGAAVTAATLKSKVEVDGMGSTTP